MSYLIALDDGHGMNTPGKRTPVVPKYGRFIHENEFNRAVVKFLDEELRRCGFRTLLVAPTDADTPLATRVNLANSKKADAYISIHYNAFDGKFDGPGKDPEGIEVFYYKGSAKGKKLADSIYKYLKQGTPQKLRGVKEGTFYVLRYTNMVSILSENGFMDNEREAILMLNVDFQKEVAMEHARGICDYFGVKYVPATSTPAPQPSTPSTGNYIGTIEVLVDNLNVRSNASFSSQIVKVIKKGQKFKVYEHKNGMYNLGGNQWTSAGEKYVRFTPAPKPQPTNNVLYKVQVGAFGLKENATAQENLLKKDGYTPYTYYDGKLYRVQVGAFGVRANAEKLEKELKAKKYNTFIVKEVK